MFAVFPVRNDGWEGKAGADCLRMVTFPLILQEEKCTGIREI